MTTKKELEERIDNMQNMMNSLLFEKRTLEMKLGEADGLIMHYEKTIAVILARKLEREVALSSQKNVGDMPNPQV